MATTIVELAHARARRQPERTAFEFLGAGVEPQRLTCADLDLRARAIAVHLHSEGVRPGDRVLLLYPPGLAYVAAFFGCLYAGVLPVPAYPPRLRPGRMDHQFQRLIGVARDARPAAALAMPDLRSGAEAALAAALADGAATDRLRWLALEELPEQTLAEAWQVPAPLRPDTPAFLQYTSGSTSEPRGVVVTHGNLLHNAEFIADRFELTPDGLGVLWLPPYHDMGLIGGLVVPVFADFPVRLMAPLTFLQRPVAWLEAISGRAGVVAGGPNFGFDLCVRSTTPEQRAGLDLSGWSVAFIGAEPVRAETLERFTEAFSASGFRREAFYPCYGLAEATLMVTGGYASEPPIVRRFDPDALAAHRVVPLVEGGLRLVGCGKSQLDQRLAIVDPAGLTRCRPGSVGEIWVAGPSVGSSWDGQAAAETFDARLADSAEGPYLRTGDLGFLDGDGELFVTGRLKDLIIVAGRNYYPQDVEQAAGGSNPSLRPEAAAAFGVDADGVEEVVLVQEVDRHAWGEAATLAKAREAIRRSVFEELELTLYEVVLVKPGAMPRTSSGKIQRRRCREQYLAGAFAESEARAPAPPPRQQPEATESGAELSQRQVEDVLRGRIARLLRTSPLQVDLNAPIQSLGLDSLKIVRLRAQVEDLLGVRVDPQRFFHDTTLAELAMYVVDQAGADGTEAPQEKKQQAAGGKVTTQSPSAAPAPASSFQTVAGGRPEQPRQEPEAAAGLQFSLLFFSANEAEHDRDKYRLLLESARFADERGFAAVWLPERHFHAFGGLYPNPSVLAAALATITRRVRLRAGSVVLPLHQPLRVAEEWAVVDHLSQGRVDLAFATGWNPNDFVLAPGDSQAAYAGRVDALVRDVREVQRLWRGESLVLPNGAGVPTEVRVHPRPYQPELNTWITCTGTRERFEQAGAIGANVLTALLFQDVDELAEKLALYRTARERSGHDPDAGQVTLMLHTYLGEDEAAVRRAVRDPFKHYLATSVDLRRHGSRSLTELSADERETLLEVAFERYYGTSALFGTPQRCLELVQRVQALGVNEIACLIDFGVDGPRVLNGLEVLDGLRRIAAGLDQRHTFQPAAVARDGRRVDLTERFRPPAAASEQDVLEKARRFDLAQRLRAAGVMPYYREVRRNEGPICVIDGRQVIMLGSNNYLGLTTDARVRDAAARAALEDGSSLTGSRLLNGSTAQHRALERKLAAFLGREDALVFTTGYQACVGLVSALMTEGTRLLLDEQCHASIYDGAFLGRAEIVQFAHNDLADLEERLAEAVEGGTPTMVMVDGVYSMAGDVAPLPSIRRLCSRYRVPLALDDAHGLGALGEAGRGTEEHFGLLGAAEAMSGTFSKSLASIGGWVAAEAYVIDYIRFHARPMLFSASLPPPSLAAASAALNILQTEPWRLERVRENACYWRDGLRRLGLDTGASATPIVPILIGDDRRCVELARALLEQGLYVNCALAPAVPRGGALLRTSVMATHERSHLDDALTIVERVVRSFDGLLQAPKDRSFVDRPASISYTGPDERR